MYLKNDPYDNKLCYLARLTMNSLSFLRLVPDTGSSTAVTLSSVRALSAGADLPVGANFENE